MGLKNQIFLIIMTLMAMILGTWKFTKAAEICKAYRCSNQTREGVCAESTADTVVLNPSTCGDKEECFFSGNETGQCAPKIDRNFPSLYYPGYNCRYEKKPGICAFGGKYCNKYGMCEGGSLDDICQRHADCHYGFYCNPFGFCVPSKEEGEACTQNEECIRGYGCFRKCIKYLSLETDEQVIPEFNRKVFSQLGNEKMCESGWYNRTTGRCFSGVKSLQKGKI